MKLVFRKRTGFCLVSGTSCLRLRAGFVQSAVSLVVLGLMWITIIKVEWSVASSAQPITERS